MLLFYLQDLTHLLSIKTEGGKIKESEALNRVVSVRTVRRVARAVELKQGLHSCMCHIPTQAFELCLKVLEKMRPLDHKLKYQIDKLVRTAITGSLGETLCLMSFMLWSIKVRCL